MTLDSVLNRLAAKIDPRTKKTQQLFNDFSAAINVTGTANVGSLVQITTASAHGMVTGNEARVSAVGGTVEANNTLANPAWVVTVTSSVAFTIPVAFVNAWISGGTVVPAMIGAVRGGSFEPAQLLEIYNQARFAAFEALRAKYSNDRRTLRAEVGSLLTSATVTFTGATPAIGPKPTGYVDWSFMRDASGLIHLLGADRAQAAEDDNPNYAASATNRFVWESGANLVHPSIFVSGNTTLYYYGISAFTLTQVLSGTAQETFNELHLSAILELAEAVSEELGGNDLIALATKLIGGGK